MNRLATYIASLLLSAVIVLLSSGLTLVHCSHSGTTSVAQWQSATPAAQPAGCCQDQGQQPCSVSSGCMQLTLVSIPQIFHTPAPAFTLQPIATELPHQLAAAPLPSISKDAGIFAEYTSATFHGPPRNWLRMLTTLQI